MTQAGIPVRMTGAESLGQLSGPIPGPCAPLGCPSPAAPPFVKLRSDRAAGAGGRGPGRAGSGGSADSWYSGSSRSPRSLSLSSAGGSVAPGQTYASFQRANPPSAWRHNCSSVHGFAALCPLLAPINPGTRHFNQIFSENCLLLSSPSPCKRRERLTKHPPCSAARLPQPWRSRELRLLQQLFIQFSL